MPRPASPPKIQRWVDLVAALLKHRFPITFEEIAREVPAYRARGAKKDTVMRMFERDKDELRAFGIAIETEIKDDGEYTGYKLAARDFYLPYLCLRTEAGGKTTKPKRPSGTGYAALEELVFEADEIDAIAEAGQLVRTLGDPVLAEEVASAMRKLAFDIPLEGLILFSRVSLSAVTRIGASVAAPRAPVLAGTFKLSGHAPPESPPRDHFEQLSRALLHRKRVRFTYFAMARGESSERVAEPYGLFFAGAHWYLAARDTPGRDVKSFRVSRISRLTVESARPQQPDFDLPADFSLREYARSRQPWELGDGEAMRATVEFTGESGATAAASRLGEPVKGSSTKRAFLVRRPDAFARWLLSFGGEATVISPPALREELSTQLERTLAVYGGGDE